ncbi:MAG: SUMF1/EgtB/PvdO family nonheme iron enzyme [Planctomycetota bacterium]
MTDRRTFFLGAVLIVCALAPAVAVGLGGDDAALIERIYAATPESTAGFSHFPVPLIYADWEAEVVGRFGRMSLAGANRHLYEDLPPAKAENEPVPENTVLAKLFAEEEDRAARVLVAALGADPKRPQWSLIAACARVPGDGPVEALVRIAGNDPNSTDRAFAVKELFRRGGERSKEALLAALLDDNQSVRRVAAHGLAKIGEELGDMIVLSPLEPQNPFHLLFLEKALGRVLPGTDVREYVGLDWHDRHAKVRAAKPALCERFGKWMLDQRARPFGAMMTWLLGTEEQAVEALATLEALLFAQGGRPDTYHSPDFWMRAAVIQALLPSRDGRVKLLAALLAKHVGSFGEAKAPIVIVLSYVFERCREPSAIPHLAKVRSLSTRTPDVYMAAAAGLKGQRSEEALPSLAHVLGLGKEPFATLAVRHLESLTGLNTPGKPRDVGMLGKLGLPQEPLDIQRSHLFWREWYEASRGRLKLDPASGRFVPTVPKPAELRSNHVLWDAASSEQRRRAAEELAQYLEAFTLSGLRKFADGGGQREVAVLTHAGTGLEFSFVPGGRYVIGSPDTEPGRYPEEVRHEVLLSPFLIGRTEVTQAVWEKAMGSNPSAMKGGDRPVDTVSWEAASRFATKTGLALPTEAQWEVACRAGASWAYSFGSDARALTLHAWYGENSEKKTHPVGRKRPNALGLHDVHGNVLEWCADGMAWYPKSPGPDPRIPPGKYCIVRGGSYNDDPPSCRSAFRFGIPPKDGHSLNGFRAAFPLAR